MRFQRTFHKFILPTSLVGMIFLAGCGNNNTAIESGGTGGSADPVQSVPGPSPEVRDRIISEYTDYVLDEGDAFLARTRAFTEAIGSGDLETARDLYAPTRMHFERIEPIAEALGDFDPRLDAREGDVDDADWRGYHRLEKLLWTGGNTGDMQTYSSLLNEDAALLRARLETVEITIPDLVTGTIELLNEISASKVTGEEEAYSHTDLWDFAANLEGSYRIFSLLRLHLDEADSALSRTIEGRFSDVFTTLSSLRNGDGYLLYTELTSEQVRTLSTQIDAVAEPLSKIGVYFPGS